MKSKKRDRKDNETVIIRIGDKVIGINKILPPGPRPSSVTIKLVLPPKESEKTEC